MSDQNSPHQSNNSLDEILKELEERFGVNTNPEEKNSDPKKSNGINFKRFGQNQVIGGLTLMLLIVGAGVGMFLGSETTENRQQAAYPTCGTGGDVTCPVGTSVGTVCGAGKTCQNSDASAACSCDASNPICDSNSPVDCAGRNPGVTHCSTGGQGLLGTCTFSAGTTCSCVGPTPTPIPGCTCNTSSDGQCIGVSTGSSCTKGGVGSTCGGSFIGGSLFCSCGGPIPPGCPGGGGSVSNTPTKTPTPVITTTNTPGQPTNTPGQPTSVPATNTPGQPTSIPATNTPTKSPTPTTVIGPTCNGIKITFGGVNEPNRDVRIGDNITLNCGTANGAFRYEFRLYLNGVLLPPINPISSSASVSQPFPIAQSGNYSAQCRMCTDNTATSCQSWEPL